MNVNGQHRFLIAYDIPNDRRRSQISKALLNYGDRVQYSVFVVDVKPAKLVALRGTLERIAKPLEDSILLCDLGASSGAEKSRFMFIGRNRPITPLGPLIV